MHWIDAVKLSPRQRAVRLNLSDRRKSIEIDVYGDALECWTDTGKVIGKAEDSQVMGLTDWEPVQ
jgi:hypothetical protein